MNQVCCAAECTLRATRFKINTFTFWSVTTSSPLLLLRALLGLLFVRQLLCLHFFVFRNLPLVIGLRLLALMPVRICDGRGIIVRNKPGWVM